VSVCQRKRRRSRGWWDSLDVVLDQDEDAPGTGDEDFDLDEDLIWPRLGAGAAR